MSSWRWRPERTEGIWRHGAPCLRPLVASAPWITVGLLLVLFWMIGGTLTTARGILFDLPERQGFADGEVTGPVALIVPTRHETLVFFDDSRYVLEDASSLSAFAAQLSEVASATDRKVLLALADRRVPCGELMRFAEIARQSGMTKVLFAEQKVSREE